MREPFKAEPDLRSSLVRIGAVKDWYVRVPASLALRKIHDELIAAMHVLRHWLRSVRPKAQTRHTDGVDKRFDQALAEAAETRGDWAAAIAMVSEFAECYSPDHYRHDAHLWHMDLLAKAGLLHELAELAKSDVHARRRLDRSLYEQGRDDELHQRARWGDKTALYLLVRLLRTRGEHTAAQQVVADIDPPIPTPSNWHSSL